jgi:hypothetical protein
MANKQNLILNRINTNLCEINNEYPLLKSYSIERHLCTSTSTKPLKIPASINISQLLNRIITQQQQQQQKDSNKHLKNSREQTEVIELFKYQQQEETDNKLYRKRRYKLSNNEEDEKRDNTN